MTNSVHAGRTDEDRSIPRRTPRICLLTETFYPVVGGGETHARLLAHHLVVGGMRIFVLTRRTQSSLPQAESVDGVPTFRIRPTGMKRMGKYAMLPWTMRELQSKRDDYDVIFVCGFRVLGIPAVMAARKLGKVCILRAETQGELSGGYASAYRSLPLGADRLFRRWIGARNGMLTGADAFVSISAPISEEFSDCGVAPDRIHQIPNGIDTGIYSPASPGVKESLRRNLGLPADRIIAMYSGKLNRGKGLEYLLRAWGEIVSTHNRLHLIFVGSGGGQSLSIEDDLRRMVGEMNLGDRVTFTGYVHNTHEYLQASDMFILPSENEGLPMSMLEAMACGIPAVATQVGGIPEVIRDRENGLLVPPRDPEALVHAVRLLADHPSLVESISTSGRETVRERYAIEAVAQTYRNLFTALCEARHNGGSA